MIKIVSVVGARPQFIKAKPVIDAFKHKKTPHVLVHTGQHYDYRMSKIFFDELEMPRPFYNLEVGSHGHGKQTALMIERIEKVLLKEKPDVVIAYGDTNSTLAAAITAVKAGVRLAHVEAGLRSFNRDMPEEINRILTDHASDMLFCPVKGAVENLAKEGITKGVRLVGDTMYDAIVGFMGMAAERSRILQGLDLKPKGYLLATIHRQSNSDDTVNLRNILSAFAAIKERIIMPVHPRTAKMLNRYGIKMPRNVEATEPVGYLDMLMLERNARVVMTDSGGMQKESYWLGVPCLTLRDETEWSETVAAGWNRVVGCDPDRIVKGLNKPWLFRRRPRLYGDGRAAEKIADHIIKNN